MTLGAVVDAVVEAVEVTSPGRPGRLTRAADVQRALRRGSNRSGDLLAVHVLLRPLDERSGPARLTVVASRRVGGAVRRNRAKRLLREAARTIAWHAGSDVVLVARAACADSDVHAVSAELGRVAAKLDAIEVAA